MCDKQGVYEKIFLPVHYELNRQYIKSLGKIVLQVEGYLTNFELSILEQCSDIIDVELHYEACRFNKKLSSKFSNLGLELEEGYFYQIDFKKLEIINKSKTQRHLNVVTQSFSQRLLQVGFVKQRIYEYINAGIDAERIVVVTPDENFADMLRDFDSEGNFNFAKGVTLGVSKFYKALKASYDYLDNSTVENRSRVQRFYISHQLQNSFKRPVNEVDFESVLAPFLEYECESRVIQIIQEELYTFKKVLDQLYGSSLKSALHLFKTYCFTIH